MKITFLLVERSFLGSLRQAADELRRTAGIDFELAAHVLAGAGPELEVDVASSVAVFAVHVTDEAAAAQVAALLDRHGAGVRAFIPLNCVASLMARARLGNLDLARRRGFMSSFGQLIRRPPSGDRRGQSFASFAARVSRWLRFAPGRGQDFRAYLQLYSYYLNGSPENLCNLLAMVLRRYGGLNVAVEPPIEYPVASLYHPDAPRLFTELDDYLAWSASRANAPSSSAPRVGLILFRSHVLNRNTAHYDAVIRAIERRGLVPLPALAFALDNREVQRRYFGSVQAILSLTGFGYVGGMGANDAPAAVDALSQQGVPYLDAVALTFQHIEDWLGSATGLNPLQSMMQVAIPELDGAIEPFIYGGVVRDSEGFQPAAERIDRLADRLARLVALRLKPNAEKRVAITVFSFPPNAGTLGTAAHLDVFASMHRLLCRLTDEGYTVAGLPGSPDELRRLVGSGIAATIPVSEFKRLWPWWREVDECWGPAPGRFNSDGADLLVRGRHFGNVLVGIQPTFGYEGDPMRLMVAHGQTPHHGFCAYYGYLQHIWNADAVVHFGTHGSLEFMPGKQVGLSGSCWPDRLIGALPHVYLYSVGNPSEGTIAKRRAYATLVSYLTPPMQEAGLYKELLQLKDLIDAYRRTSDPELLAEIEELSNTLSLGRERVGERV